MKVSTKILLGYGILVALMAFGLGYELIVLDRLQATNERLSDVRYSTLEVTQLGENLRVVQEFTEKYLTVDAQAYEEQLGEFLRSFPETLESIRTVVGSEEERRAIAQLDATWWEFVGLLEETKLARPPGTYEYLPPRLDALLSRMRPQVGRVSDAVRNASILEVQLAEETREHAHWVARIVALAAIGLAGGVGLSVTRSIQGSFRSFMDATASVAQGDFQRPVPEAKEDEFGELARSFNAMAARLEELDRLKKDFVSSVSHELKSPIASSKEIVQLLLDEVPGPLNSEQRRLLELSVRSSRRLAAMIGSLLDLVRMDAGTMRYEKHPRDLKALVSSALEEFEIAAQERDLRIDANLDDVEPVHCDADRIVQVVGNLVDNAMKFSKRGSRIAVRLENMTDGSDTRLRSGAMFSIIDEGVGVPDSFKKRIFARFQQVKTDGARQQGVGLGLAISRSIVEDHGGRIWVEDNPRGGAVFRFVLPYPAVEARSPEAERTIEV